MTDKMYTDNYHLTNTPYQYRPLVPSHGRIRLLHLPASGTGRSTEGPLSGTITDASLSDERLQYTALSYCWGNLSLDTPIFLNRTPFYVTENLEQALRHLQRPDKATTFWVDAICIDQSDDDEKSQQVQQMKDIYARAQEVIVWLGPSKNDSDVAMQWIREYGSWASRLRIGETPELRLRHLLDTLDANGSKSLSPDMASFLEKLKEQLAGSATSNPLVIPSLSNFFDRAYWSRVWTVQEVARGQTVKFRCGNVTVTEDELHHATRLLRNFRRYQSLRLGAGHSHVDDTVSAIDVRNPITLLKIRRAGVSLSLIYLLRTCRRFRATDPRDKVFALLGIADDAGDLGVLADYRMGRNQVYITVAKRLILNGYAEVLTLSRFFRGSTTNLPSFVPDWSRRLTHSTPLQQRALDRDFGGSTLQPPFSASHHRRQMVQMDPTFSHTSDERAVLTIQAIHIGDVEELGHPWSPDGAGQWLHDVNLLSRKISAGESEEQMRAVWRTAVADQMIRDGDEKSRLPEEALADIHSLLMVESDLKGLSSELLADMELGSFSSQLSAVARGRRPFLLNDGAEQRYLAIGPDETQVGDAIYIILGLDVPAVVRKERGKHRIVGEAYVDRAMDGELSHAVADTLELH
jgi:hypothetical protein